MPSATIHWQLKDTVPTLTLIAQSSQTVLSHPELFQFSFLKWSTSWFFSSSLKTTTDLYLNMTNSSRDVLLQCLPNCFVFRTARKSRTKFQCCLQPLCCRCMLIKCIQAVDDSDPRRVEGWWGDSQGTFCVKQRFFCPLQLQEGC
mmetsp:Transcript_4275/g.7059  ORF Transcript_4275/g.7059 Transcript_4275/m.7059 type:complete len:145 (-) Transcript_4275:274-708(-)